MAVLFYIGSQLSVFYVIADVVFSWGTKIVKYEINCIITLLLNPIIIIFLYFFGEYRKDTTQFKRYHFNHLRISE